MINLKRVQLKAEYKLWQIMTYGKVQFMPADKFNGVLHNFLLKNLPTLQTRCLMRRAHLEQCGFFPNRPQLQRFLSGVGGMIWCSKAGEAEVSRLGADTGQLWPFDVVLGILTLNFSQERSKLIMS